MTRSYTLNRRAERQAETRRKIVEAAIDLHGTIGPAQTSISMVAERAGVQRHTFYAHFPDEKDLLLACSGLSLERDPLPDPIPWQDIEDGAKRLRTALGELYAWYGRNAELTGCVLRDAQYHPATREIAQLRFGPAFAAYELILGAGLRPHQQPLVRLALSFFTWRNLVRETGLKKAEAVETMARAIEGSR